MINDMIAREREKVKMREEWIEKNRDSLEKAYYEAYKLSLEDCFDGMGDAFKKFESALVSMGILEEEGTEQ